MNKKQRETKTTRINIRRENKKENIYYNQRVLYYARSAIFWCPDVPGRGAGPKKNSNWLKTAKR